MSSNAHNSESILKIHKIESTVILTLNRPSAGNSMSYELALELDKSLQSIRTDSSVTSVIITGEGDKFFCTGGDVKKYASFNTKEELQLVFDKICDVLDLIESIDIPFIAAINGFAIGGGLELALACDLRVIKATAEVGFPQSRIGVIPGWNGIERLLNTTGRGIAMKMLLTGDRINAAEALRVGLAEEVAHDQSVLQCALSLAQRMQSAAPMSLGSVKKVVRSHLHYDKDQTRKLARDEFARLWFSKDHKEAEAAFAQKRQPIFVNE
jgi:enoyl-CoA hydratase/carnithine racemase